MGRNRSDHRVLTGLGTAAVAILLPTSLVACGGDDGDRPTGSSSELPTSPLPTSASTDPSSSTPSTAQVPTETRALIRAGRSGLERIRGAVYSIESENSGGLWEVEVVRGDTKYEMHVSGDGRTVVRPPKADGRAAKYRARVKGAELDFEEAVKAILAEVPGASFDELNLDTERGRVVWEADVTDGSGVDRSLEIDARNGTVLENKPDS